MDGSPLLGMQVTFANIFSHYVGYIFPLLIVPFHAHIFLSFTEVRDTYFFFCCICFCCHIFELCLIQCNEDLFLMWKLYNFSSYTYVYDPFWVNFYVAYKVRVFFYLSIFRAILSLFVEKIILPVTELSCTVSRANWP